MINPTPRYLWRVVRLDSMAGLDAILRWIFLCRESNHLPEVPANILSLILPGVMCRKLLKSLIKSGHLVWIQLAFIGELQCA